MLEAIKVGQVGNVKQALEFQKSENLWFGPYSDIFDFLGVKVTEGVINFNPEEELNKERTITFIKPEDRPKPLVV